VRIFEISDRIVTSVFDSAQLFEIFEYLPSPISYLFNRMTPIFHLATTPSNQQNQQTCGVVASSKDSKRSLIWSHFTQIGSDNTNIGDIWDWR